MGNESFMLTYGDGVCDVDMREIEKFHRSHGKIGTITAINVDQRFGVLDLDDDGTIQAFREKNEMDKSVINGGYMMFEPQVFDLLSDDSTVFEKYPMETLAKTGQLMAYRHEGFWQCMDTQRDKNLLESLWATGKAPWKKWE